MGDPMLGEKNAAQPSFLHGPIDMTEAERRELADWRVFYRKCAREYGTPLRPFGEREYVALYVAQGGRCAICRTAKGRDPREPLAYAGRKRKPRRLAVDHNHLTGLVRGLLCSGSLSANTCNRLVARYDADALMRAVHYLRLPPATRMPLVEPDPEVLTTSVERERMDIGHDFTCALMTGPHDGPCTCRESCACDTCVELARVPEVLTTSVDRERAS